MSFCPHCAKPVDCGCVSHEWENVRWSVMTSWVGDGPPKLGLERCKKCGIERAHGRMNPHATRGGSIFGQMRSPNYRDTPDSTPLTAGGVSL